MYMPHNTEMPHNADPAPTYAAVPQTTGNESHQETWETAYRFNSVPQTNSLQYHLQIGQMVINECFGGSIDAWRHQGSRGRKFKELAKSPSLNVTRIMLSRAVRIYAMYMTYGGDQRWPSLSVSHYRAVHSLPEREQVDLLDMAQAERWTSTQLDSAVSSIHARAAKPRPGRRGRHPLVKSLDRADKILEAEFERMEREAVATGDHATAAAARELWAQFRRQMTRVVQPQAVTHPDNQSGPHPVATAHNQAVPHGVQHTGPLPSPAHARAVHPPHQGQGHHPQHHNSPARGQEMHGYAMAPEASMHMPTMC